VLSLPIPDAVTSRLGRKTIATILAVVPGFIGIFGIGHIYLGAVRRGIGILAIGIGLVLIFYPGYVSLQYASASMDTFGTTTIVVISLVMAGFAAVGLWIWQILDARKIAKKQTVEVEEK
jgi:hypothetical protein